jgi:uncharacterized protein YpuA (DUF1002 family)
LAIENKVKAYEGRKAEFNSKIIAKLEEHNKLKDIVDNPDKYSKIEVDNANIKVNYINSEMQRIQQNFDIDGEKVTNEIKQILEEIAKTHNSSGTNNFINNLSDDNFLKVFYDK